MQGQLFSSDFLLRGIRETKTWDALDEAAPETFIAWLRALFAPFSAASALNEAQTEDELIKPVLDLLGWEDARISQVNLSQTGREDVPDYLLFAEPSARERALRIASDDVRARHGVALLEAKRWLRPLDRGEDGAAGNRKRRDFGAPSSQMLRHLSRADVLALSYTAHDLAPFARELGYVDEAGEVRPPLVWDPEDRARRMARLDALFFHLYGLDAADADHVLSTFPIVREQDLKAYGRFRTRDLILEHLDRIGSGRLSEAP